jgi:hypothetical protein
MIHTGHPWPRATSVAALPMENADCGTRNLFFMSIELPARSTLRTTRRRDATPILILNTEHFTFSTFWRSPASLSFAAPYATARCSYLASIASGFHALRDRRNPAAGPVIAATSMHAAGCAFSFIYQPTQSVSVIHANRWKMGLNKKCPHGYRQILATPTCG